MKDERNVRQSRAAGGRWRPVAILLAAVLMVLSVPLGGRPAYAVDLDQSCSVLVNPGSITMSDDLALADVTIDLYRIADAVPVAGFDTYDWQLNAGFEGVEITKDIDAAGWKAAAQTAAGVVLGEAPEGETEWDPSDNIAALPKVDESGAALVYSGKAGTTITGLKAGLYLIIAHGGDGSGGQLEKYAAVGSADETDTASGTEDADAADESAETTANGIVTLANSRLYAYQFSPELISLPTKGADASGVINTANTGDWIYTAEQGAVVTLKPSRSDRIGALDVVKTLVTYEEREKTTAERTENGTTEIKDKATFIFDVSVFDSKADYEAQKEAGGTWETWNPTVYHDQVSIIFDSYGTKRVHIGDLPVDSYAVVTEIYPEEGAGLGHYYLIEKDGEKTIIANETVEATFKNDYNNEHGGGGSVTNRFSYDTRDGWVLNQVADDTDASVEDPINTWKNQ